ncbi:MAG: hypothetical protein IPN63_13375 [Gammaproteobacteria bacterium]|nr:hypothetical protein [Gammaproteobacteria bacterium]
MKHYLLDTSALLTLRDDESGADRVAEILALSGHKKARCSGCFMSLMEVSVWKDEGEASGDWLTTPGMGTRTPVLESARRPERQGPYK